MSADQKIAVIARDGTVRELSAEDVNRASEVLQMLAGALMARGSMNPANELNELASKINNMFKSCLPKLLAGSSEAER
jgi:uncharacterized membrane protein